MTRCGAAVIGSRAELLYLIAPILLPERGSQDICMEGRQTAAPTSHGSHSESDIINRARSRAEADGAAEVYTIRSAKCFPRSGIYMYRGE